MLSSFADQAKESFLTINFQAQAMDLYMLQRPKTQGNGLQLGTDMYSMYVIEYILLDKVFFVLTTFGI